MNQIGKALRFWFWLFWRWLFSTARDSRAVVVVEPREQNWEIN